MRGDGSFVAALAALWLAIGATALAADHEAPAWSFQQSGVLIYPTDGSGSGPTTIALPASKVGELYFGSQRFLGQSARFSKLSGQIYMSRTTKTSCSITVIDPVQKRVADVLQLSGACAAVRMSEDGSRIAVLLTTKDAPPLTHTQLFYEALPGVSIVSINTMSNKIDAVYKPMGPGVVRPVSGGGFQINHVDSAFETNAPLLISPSGRRLAVMVTTIEGKEVTEELQIFGPDPGQAPARIALGDMGTGDFEFSKDEKVMFVLQSQKVEKKDIGTVALFGADDGKLISRQTVGKHPSWLRRFGSHSGFGILCDQEVWFVSEEGVLSEGKIALKTSEEAGSAGPPGLFSVGDLLVGEDLTAIPILDDKSEPKHLVALVDFRKGQVASLVKIGRSSVRRDAVLKALPFGLWAGAVYSMTNPRNSTDLATSSDGKSLFVFERASQDVTVIQLPDGKVTGYLPVDKSTSEIWMAKGSRYLFCLGEGDEGVRIFDTSGAEKQQRFSLEGGKLIRIYANEDSPQLKLVMEKATFIWDGLTGKLISGNTLAKKVE